MSIKNFFRFRYYRKLVCSFVLIGVLLISICIGSISLLFSRFMGDRMGEMATASIRQTSVAFSQILSECQNAVTLLMNEGDFYSVTMGSSINRLKDFQMLESIERIQASYPYVRYMGVVNSNLNRYVGTRGVYTGCDDEIGKAQNLNGQRAYELYLRTVRTYENTQESAKVQVLTYLYTPYSERQSGSCIILDLDLDFLVAQIEVGENDLWEGIALLDENASPVLNSSSGAWQGTLQETDAKHVLSNTEKYDWFYSTKVVEDKALIAYCRLSEIPWTVVGVQSWEKATSIFENTKYIFVGGALLAIAIYLVLSIFFSNYIYSPIKNIRNAMLPETGEQKSKSLDELETIGNLFHRYVQQEDRYRWNNSSERELVREFLFGQRDIREFGEQDWKDPLLKSIAVGRFYVVAVISADSISYKNEVYSDRLLYLFVLRKMVDELLQEAGILCFPMSAEKSGNDFIVICATEKSNIPPKMEMGIEEIQSCLQREFHISVSIGISQVRSGSDSLQAAFQGANQALKLRVQQGPFLISIENSSTDNNSKQDYPLMEEKKIQEAVVEANMEQAENAIRAFFVKLRRECPGRAVLNYRRLYFSTLLQGVSHWGLPDAEQEYLWEGVLGLQCLDEMESAYINLCQKLIKRENKDQGYSSAETAVEAVKKYIDNHCEDTSISLKTLAEKAGITPSYLGQVFLKKYGISCVEYTNQVRMEKASQLLLKTNLTIQQISEQVGILNTNYFYTLFKREYGLTPSRYRASKKE
jgi:two-component system response regulator YesN